MATATEEKVVEKNLLEAEPRTAGNKNEARRVRRGGKIPAVLYGAGKDALALSLDPRQVSRILRSETGYNTVFELELEGNRTKAGKQRPAKAKPKSKSKSKSSAKRK